MTALSQARAATASSLRSHVHQVATAPFRLNNPLTKQLHDILLTAESFRPAACDAQPQPAPGTAPLSPARHLRKSCICPYCNTTPCDILHKLSLSLSQPAAARPSPSQPHALRQSTAPAVRVLPALRQSSTTNMTDVDALPSVARLLDAASRAPNSYSSSRRRRKTHLLRWLFRDGLRPARTYKLFALRFTDISAEYLVAHIRTARPAHPRNLPSVSGPTAISIRSPPLHSNPITHPVPSAIKRLC